MLEIRLSGRFEVKLDGRAVPLSSRPAQSLFAYLALSAGTAHRREKLAGLLWPESSDDNARRNLRQSLWHIRKALADAAPHYLHSNDMTVAFINAPFWLDVALLEKPTDANATPEELMAVVAVYGGELLPGFYDDWVVWQRDRQQTLFERKMEQLLEKLTAVHRWNDLLEWGERWLAFGQSPEAAYRALMMAHAGRGDLARMATAYRRCVDALENELGVEPSAQTRALFERLAHSQDTDMLAAAFFPLPHQLTEETGGDGQSQAHQPQPKWEPPDATTAVHDTVTLSPPQPTTHFPRHNLPQSLTSFIGRQTEIAHLHKQLLNPANRLVTLTGPGGTGKTRLSLEAVGRLRDAFADGVWLVELAPLADPAFVTNAVASVFELREEGGRPLATVLTDYLQAKQLLLILDNCEHLIESCARLAESWLETCPRLTILTTSREALAVPGEVIVHVPPLAVPDPEQTLSLAELAEVEAVQLFVERARTTLPNFTLAERNSTAVTQVCQRLDGIPLALELAAARVKVLQVEQIASRLDDRFRLLTGGSRTALPRQQTLRATIDWSYDLLTEQEQHLLQRLSVFVGGWTLAAAEAVCADEHIHDDEMLDLLTQLVNKSLVLAERMPGQEARYWLSETIRQYAQEKGGQNLPAWQSVQERHSTYYSTFVYEHGEAMKGPQQLAAIRSVVADFANVRVAWFWHLENERFDKATQMLFGLFGGYIGSFLYAELSSLVEAAISRLEKIGLSDDGRLLYLILYIIHIEDYTYRDPNTLQLVYVRAGNREKILQLWNSADQLQESPRLGFWFILLARIYSWLIDQQRGIESLNQYLAQLSTHHDSWLQARGLLTMGILWNPLDEEKAEKYLREAQTLFHHIGNRLDLASTQKRLATVNRVRAPEKAIQSLQLACRLYEEMGLANNLVGATLRLADLNLLLGNNDAAFQEYYQARQIAQKIGAGALQDVLHHESMAHIRYGDLGFARQLRQQCIHLMQTFHREYRLAWGYWEMGEIERIARDLAAARQWFDASLALFVKLQHQIGIAFYERGMGNIAQALGHYEGARQLFTSAIQRLRGEGHLWGVSCTLSGVGRAEVELGLFELARDHFLEAWQLANQLSNRDLCLEALAGLAALHAALTEYEQAVTLSKFVTLHPASWNETKERATAVYETAVPHLTSTQKHNALAAGQAMSLDEAIAFALQEP